MKQFNQNLKALRLAKRYNQNRLAEEFGVKQGGYAKWENKSEPPYDTLVKICRFFRVSIDDMLTKDLSVSPNILRDSEEVGEYEKVSEREVKLNAVIADYALAIKEKDELIEVHESELLDTLELLKEVALFIDGLDINEKTVKEQAEMLRKLEVILNDGED